MRIVMIEIIDVPVKRIDFDHGMWYKTSRNCFSMKLNPDNPLYSYFEELVPISDRRGELGFINLVVEGEQSFQVRLVSVKKDGDAVVIETRLPGSV